jgi:hypothetical protein
MNFYSLLQNQVRFAGEMKMGAGNFGGVTWGNTKVDAYPAVLDTDWFCLTLSDLIRDHGRHHQADVVLEAGRDEPGQIPTLGSTAFGDQLVFAYQIGARAARATPPRRA